MPLPHISFLRVGVRPPPLLTIFPPMHEVNARLGIRISLNTISAADGNNSAKQHFCRSQVSLSHTAPPIICITRSRTLFHAKHETARSYFVSLWKAATLCAYALINHTIGHTMRSPSSHRAVMVEVSLTFEHPSSRDPAMNWLGLAPSYLNLGLRSASATPSLCLEVRPLAWPS